MRLDRWLTQALPLSRSQARRLITQGEVRVDGSVVCDAALQVADAQQVLCQGQLLAAAGPRYLMLHKPLDTVCSRTGEPSCRSALDLIDLPRREQLHFAGRLDRDTTGLVLLTDDGQWSHRLTSPRRHCIKVYRVGLAQPLMADAETRLAEGLWLHGESKPTLPAVLQRLSDTDVRLSLQEGRYHQVKRMMAALGNRVLHLHRERIGHIVLDEALAPGQWRFLNAAEITLSGD